MMTDYITYFNGEWVPFSEVKIDPMDRAFMSGDVVFDVARTFNGKSFRLRRHIDRLYRSLKFVRIDPGLSADEMLDISEEAVRRNEDLRPEAGDFTITQFVTRGVGRRTRDATTPSVCVKIDAVGFNSHVSLYEAGAHGIITRTRSYSPDALDPKIKHYSRMNFALADLEAADVDPEGWAILTDSEGNITEGTGYNVFMVTDGVIRTAGDRDLLQGVSRGMVMDLARQMDIPLEEGDLQPYDLYTADEAFFSSTSYCVLPVTRVDKRQIADGQPGPVTQQLLAAWSESVGLDIVDQAQRFAR